jgi:hypothetical protein
MPDCTVYDQVHENVLHANSAISNIYIEFKSKAEEDAFLINIPDKSSSVSSPLMNPAPQGVLTAGQITTYTALQLDSRIICMFSVSSLSGITHSSFNGNRVAQLSQHPSTINEIQS